jgi:hypothetical protein
MTGINPFEGSEYTEALETLRTILQERRYEDFYNAIQVYLVGQDVDPLKQRRYVIDNIVLPFVLSYVIGRKLHGEKLIISWQDFFVKTFGKTWETHIIDAMPKGAEAFAKAVKAILKNIEEFGKG